MRTISSMMAALWLGGVAAADIGTPTWNWSSFGNWGHGYTATFGQTFLGNGELATGIRVRFTEESCCSSWPYRIMICRWDDAANRAIAPILSQAGGIYSNYGCCWFDKEQQLDQGILLENGVRYVVFFTVTPTWSSYCCRWVRFAIHSDGNYGGGQFWYTNNGGSQAGWFNSGWNATGYDLNFTVRTTTDCDGNGVTDSTELAKGVADDCNEDQIIDSCQGNIPQDVSLTGTQGPIGTGIERQFLFEDVVPSDGNVTLTVEASGDLSATHEFLLLSIGGGTPTPIFTGTQVDCSTLSAQFSYTEAQFDQFIAGGDLDIRVGASGTVDPTACGGSSSVTVRVDYRERYSDCNGNGVPDPVDICSAATPDCNGNFIPDSCDIAAGDSIDLDTNAQPDECQFDCNSDQRPDIWQIATGELPDCNLNGVLDVCDLAAGASQDCNGNGIPDECDVAAGSVADCDGDIVPDQCAILSGLVSDCDGNGVPDGCDVKSGAVPDCNGNGVPDSCDVSVYQDQHETETQSPFNGQYAIEEVLKGISPIERDIELRLNYYAYTRAASNITIRVYLDHLLVVNQADDYWGGCYSLERTYWISRDHWNQAAVDGEVEWRIDTNAGDNCGSTTFCRGTIRYPSFADCNSTGIPDSCELAANPVLDCNGNGRIDTCEITSGAEDKNQNGHLDACELARGDLDLDGVVGGGDLAVLLSLWGVIGSPVGDLNADDVIDAMDATILLGNWGTTP